MIEPPLWHRNETKTFPKEGIAFTLTGRSIKAELNNPSITEEEFRKKASGIAKKSGDIYNLVKGRFFEVVGLTSRVQFVRSSQPVLQVIEKGRISAYGSDASQHYWEGSITEMDAVEKQFNLFLTIFDLYEMNGTLQGAISYYSLALEGADQLATAGNLYMAMEELLARFSEGKKKKDWRWEEVANQLVQFNSKLSKDNLLTLKQLHRARHAIDDNGNRNVRLPSQELAKDKRLVREYLLAYVEWLKRNS